MSAASTFNGMNGTIMLNTGNDELTAGTVPGASYGYKQNLRVTVAVRIEREERRESYETIEHEQVAGPLGIAVTTSVWQPDGRDIVSGGATRDPLREVAVEGTPGRFWDAGSLTELADLGDRWHLNAMRAGCAHQDVVWEDSSYGRRPSLGLTPPCPETGYRYGTAWLVELLPASVVADVLRLLSGPIGNRNVYVHSDLTGTKG